MIVAGGSVAWWPTGLSLFAGLVASCYAEVMAVARNTVMGLGALALIAGGIVLWSEFGTLVYFDMLASAFAGCFL